MRRRVDYEQLDKNIENLENLKAEITSMKVKKADPGESMGPAISEIDKIGETFNKIQTSLALLTEKTCDYLKAVEREMKDKDKKSAMEIGGSR